MRPPRPAAQLPSRKRMNGVSHSDELREGGRVAMAVSQPRVCEPVSPREARGSGRWWLHWPPSLCRPPGRQEITQALIRAAGQAAIGVSRCLMAPAPAWPRGH